MKVTENYLKQLIRESIQEQQGYAGDVSELHEAMNGIASVIKVLQNFSDSNEYGIDVSSKHIENAKKIEMFISDAIDSMQG